MQLADADALEQMAAELEARAEEVRDEYHRFRDRVAAVHWVSDGAAAYRAYCQALCDDLEGNARALEDAASDLRAHAKAVRERIAWMHDMVDDLRRRAEEAWEATGDAVEGAFEWTEDKASDAWRTVRGWF